MAAISLLLLVLSISSPLIHGNSKPADDCGPLLEHMIDCLSVVTNGSRVDKPEGKCCSSIKTILDTKAECLCEGLKYGVSMGFNITRASTLPALCKLNAPPDSSCPLSTTPPAATVPGPVPAAGSRSTPASAPAPSPSQKNHGSSLIPISGLSFFISGALVILFSYI